MVVISREVDPRSVEGGQRQRRFGERQARLAAPGKAAQEGFRRGARS
jgi:hypothetical protein